MPRYRKKPVEVEAWQVGSDEPMPEWAQKACRGVDGDKLIFVVYGSGYIRAKDGMWIVKREDDISILSNLLFEHTYEVME